MRMSLLDCATCGVPFAVTERFENERRADHHSFYCPFGHENYFAGPSDLEKLKREKAEAENKLQAELNQERHLRLVAEKAHEKAAREKRRLERRVSAGVCPCCNRTFEDLAKHMGMKHKEFALRPGNQKRIEGAMQ